MLNKLPHFLRYLIILAISLLGFTALDALLGLDRVWTFSDVMILTFVMLWSDEMDKKREGGN